MSYFFKPIVCDYGVYEHGNPEMICMCNIRRNAELIADILNADSAERQIAYDYSVYPNAKYKVIEATMTRYDEVINFCEWVANEVLKEELWEVNSDSFAEIACRKLYKLGIIEKQGDSWVYKEK